jgi:hypothetical protein
MNENFRDYLDRLGKQPQQQIALNIAGEVLEGSISHTEGDYLSFDTVHGDPPNKRRKLLRVPIGAITWVEER